MTTTEGSTELQKVAGKLAWKAYVHPAEKQLRIEFYELLIAFAEAIKKSITQ